MEPRIRLDTGVSLIVLAETMVCGRTPSASVAEARGLVLAGVRAATVGACDLAGAEGFPAVHHVAGYGQSVAGAVVLAAGTHQSAVSLVPAAHFLAEGLQRPVLVMTDPDVWTSLGAACLSDPLPPSWPQPVKNTPPPELSAARVLQVLSAQDLGFPQLLAGRPGKEGSPVILTAGAFAQEVEELVATAGDALTHLRLRLVQPLPLELLAARLNGREVVLVGPAGSPVHHELFDSLRDAQDAGLLAMKSLRALSIPLSAAQTSLSVLLTDCFPAVTLIPDENKAGLRIGVAPGGRWARELLLQIGAGLAVPAAAEISGPWSESVNPALAELSVGFPDSPELDLLIVHDHPLADPTRAVRRLRQGAELVLQSPATDPVAAWRRLPRIAREAVRERQVRLWWVGRLEGLVPSDVAASYRDLLAETSLTLLRFRLASGTEYPSGPEVETAVLLDPSTLDAGLEPEIGDLLPEPRLPREPEPSGPPASGWPEALRHFHLTATPLGTEHCWSPDLPLVPAAVLPAVREETLSRSFPFFIPAAGSGKPRPLSDLLDELTAQGGDSGIVRRFLPALVEAAGTGTADPAAPRAVVEEAASWVSAILGTAPEALRKFEAELRQLTLQIPPQGRVERFAPDAWLGFLAAAASGERHRKRQEIRQRWQRLVDDLDALLLADRQLAPEAASADALGAGLGEVGTRRVDLGRLARSLPPRTGSQGLGPERRGRIEAARRVLADFLAASASWPEVWLVHDPQLPAEVGVPGWRQLPAENDPFAAAAGLHDGLAELVVRAARAARVAQLERTHDFVPALHQAAIDRLGWQGLEDMEVALLPLIVVYETAGRLARGKLDAFHRLIRSGRPVKVVLAEPETLVEEGSELGGALPDLGYLALAHREAWVFQCPLSQPDRLLEGFQRMLDSPRTGVAVVSLPHPAEDRQQAWHRWVTAVHARSFPLFRYDPGAGESWAERFSLDGNPSPDQPWVTQTWDYQDRSGATATLSESLTYAHVAAQNPALRRHFCVIPPEAWAEDQVPMVTYLSEYRDEPPPTLPYIWILDEDGRLQRAVITRELAYAARDRDRTWRLLQELAGIRSVRVERAVEAAQRQVSEKLLSDEEQRLAQARQEGAQQAVDRILARLVGLATGLEMPPIGMPQPSSMPSSQAPESLAPSAAPGPPPEVSVQAPAPEEEEASEVSAEPYIDSFLCTSCNECINLNPRMFKYNHDKQAYLADPAAGTFLQLVKAAEACPARCIHPGQPRAGDSTATPEVLARAKAFS
jgi:ferredoxin